VPDGVKECRLVGVCVTPDAPSTHPRYDSTHCFTNVTGPHAAACLRCFEITGEVFFRDVALTYIGAWLNYAWDENAGLFFGTLTLDGVPIPDHGKGEGYDVWMPKGYADTWPSNMYSYDQPLVAALACIYAYELTGEAVWLGGAQRWARHIRANFPPAIGRRWRKEIEAEMPDAIDSGGGYAEGYGRAISFFVRLHRATGAAADLDTARYLADDAIEKLYENGWFKGHAGKP